jgi:hypothetical protein
VFGQEAVTGSPPPQPPPQPWQDVAANPAAGLRLVILVEHAVEMGKLVSVRNTEGLGRPVRHESVPA